MKTRVLVIDDDRLVADTLSLIYNTNGYECEARYSAAEGFERARDFSPDLLLCDVTMPEENGLQLAHRMEEAMPQTRVLMLTAYASNAAKVSAYSRRLRRPIKLLSKPCRPDDLLRESRQILQA
ncbi:MAG TPA: response regulator [Acidobacteriaceae bacterium]|nr:response regulator [Acidobacteriaceae bacterium]